MEQKAKNNAISKWIGICLLLVVGGLLLNRLRFCINLGDETLNVGLALKIAKGQRPFVDCWEVYQTGALFLAPFLWIYLHLTGSSAGIILFSRIVYFVFNLVLCVITYHCLKGSVKKTHALAIGCILMCFAPFALYYFWYDTVMIYFSFLGMVLLVPALQNRESAKGMRYAIFAGMAHACMCLGYPTYVLVALTIFFVLVILTLKDRKSKEKNRVWLGYAIGGMIIALLLFLYLLIQGKENIAFLNPEIAKVVFARKDYSAMAASIYWSTYEAVANLKWYLIPAIITGITWLIGLISKKKGVRMAVLLEIVLLPVFVFNHIVIQNLDVIYYLFWIFCWSPFLLFYISPTRRKQMTELFWIAFPASVIGFYVVGYTSDNGGVKSPMGVTVGVVVVLMEIAITLHEMMEEEIKLRQVGKILLSWGMVLIVGMEIGIFYTNTFFYADISECKETMESGVYKGLRITEEDKKYEKLEKLIETNRKEGDKTILAIGTELMTVYLYDDLLPATYLFSWLPYTLNEDQTQNWDATFLFWKMQSGEPDLIVVPQEQELSGDIVEVLEKEYSLADEGCGVYIYHKLGDETK